MGWHEAYLAQVRSEFDPNDARMLRIQQRIGDLPRVAN